MEGYLISQVKLNLENKKRQALKDQVLKAPETASISSVTTITRDKELEEEAYREDDYTDSEFSDIPSYNTYTDEDAVDLDAYTDEPPSDEDVYEEDCHDGYTWCEETLDCIGVDEECG